MLLARRESIHSCPADRLTGFHPLQLLTQLSSRIIWVACPKSSLRYRPRARAFLKPCRLYRCTATTRLRCTTSSMADSPPRMCLLPRPRLHSCARLCCVRGRRATRTRGCLGSTDSAFPVLFCFYFSFFFVEFGIMSLRPGFLLDTRLETRGAFQRHFLRGWGIGMVLH